MWDLSDIRPVSGYVPATEENLARARRDPAFKHRLLATNLDRLLAALNRLQRISDGTDPDQARQIREGVALALKLADRIRELIHHRPGEPRAA
jgi:hypothetical protein